MKKPARRIFCSSIGTLGYFTLNRKYQMISKVSTGAKGSYVFALSVFGPIHFK